MINHPKTFTIDSITLRRLGLNSEQAPASRAAAWLRFLCTSRLFLVSTAVACLISAPNSAFGQAGAAVTVVGMHEMLEKTSQRVQEALAIADGNVANRLNQIQLTLSGLMRDLEKLKNEGVTDLNKTRDNFTQDALTAIQRASAELSSLSTSTANSLNDALLETELMLDSVPGIKVRPHLIGQKPYVLRKPASGDVEVELVGFFPIGADNSKKYPIRLHAKGDGREIPLRQTRFGHYVFTVPKAEAQNTFRYVLTFPVKKRFGGLFGADYETDVGTLAVGKALPFQFTIRYLHANPAASATVEATRSWRSQTIRNGELPNGIVSARDLFSACVENSTAYDLRTVRIANLGNAQFDLHKSCGRCGNASGELVSWNADEVKYRLRAPRTGPHHHVGNLFNYTGVPQGTNRHAALILQPTFSATRIGSQAVIPLRDEVAKSEEDDVREFEIQLLSPWSIDIICVYDNGVQTRRSAVNLTPDSPQRITTSWKAEYDGRRLRVATF